MKATDLLILGGVALAVYLFLHAKWAGASASSSTGATSSTDYNGVNIGRGTLDNLYVYYRDGA